jgi:hypothetical protein
MPPGDRPVRVEIRFDRLQTLPAGDGREVGARLSSAAAGRACN